MVGFRVLTTTTESAVVASFSKMRIGNAGRQFPGSCCETWKMDNLSKAAKLSAGLWNPARQGCFSCPTMNLFGLSDVEFALRNTHPGLASSGLGGSATANTAVCLLANELAGHPFGPTQLVALASRMEQDLGVSITGTQEQSNVIFGGVTDYLWFSWGLPGRAESGYGCSLRYDLIPEKDYPELEQRMAISHTGHTRASTDVNAVWTRKLATKAGHALHQCKFAGARGFVDEVRCRSNTPTNLTIQRLCPNKKIQRPGPNSARPPLRR